MWQLLTRSDGDAAYDLVADAAVTEMAATFTYGPAPSPDCATSAIGLGSNFCLGDPSSQEWKRFP